MAAAKAFFGLAAGAAAADFLAGCLGLAARRGGGGRRGVQTEQDDLTINGDKAGGMAFAGMDQEGAAIDLDQVKPLLRCQRQILDMLHPAIGMDAAGDAATMTPHKPHQREQHHQKRDDDDDLFERDNRLYRHGKAP